MRETLEFSPAGWTVVNDGVMGGCSRSRIDPTEDGLRFSGHLSLDNGGGFASIRCSLAAPPDGAGALRFEARGDGRRYQCRFRQGDPDDGVAWRFIFPTASDWRSVTVPFHALRPVFRGRAMPAAGPLQAETVGQLGFLLADGREGDFELSVRRFRWATEARGGQAPTAPSVLTRRG